MKIKEITVKRIQYCKILILIITKVIITLTLVQNSLIYIKEVVKEN